MTLQSYYASMSRSLALTTIQVKIQTLLLHYQIGRQTTPGKTLFCKIMYFKKKGKEKKIGLKGKIGTGPDHSKLRECWDHIPRGKQNQSVQLKITTDVCTQHQRPPLQAVSPRLVFSFLQVPGPSPINFLSASLDAPAASLDSLIQWQVQCILKPLNPPFLARKKSISAGLSALFLRSS